jgi:hypothetical protein
LIARTNNEIRMDKAMEIRKEKAAEKVKEPQQIGGLDLVDLSDCDVAN